MPDPLIFMTSDELIKAAFAFEEKYPPAEHYDFRLDADFLACLHTRFAYVEDFLKVSSLVYEHKINFAAIGIMEGKPLIYLNPDRLTFMWKGVHDNKWPVSLFYETLGCLLWHETLHVELRHFRHAGSNSPAAASRWNVAQDMVIDNLIHSRYPGWRNWHSFVDEVNQRIAASGKGNFLQKISVETPAAGEIHISQLLDKNLIVYFNLLELDTSEPDRQRIDEHRYGGTPDPLKKSGGASSGEAPGENIFDQLEGWARSRNEKTSKRPLAQPELGDIIAQKTAEGRRYNLLQVLKRYLRKISLKQKTYSWKKIGRKQPGSRPGIIRKKQPGEVLFVVDTSGSMAGYIQAEFSGLVNELYAAFSRLAKMQGAAFSRFYQLEADEQVRAIKPIENPEALKSLVNGSLKGMGGTDYRPVFEWVVKNWRKSGTTQALPDLILFLTDLDASLDFLNAAKYAAFESRLVWLYTRRGVPVVTPPRGDVCNVFPDDFGANAPYYSEGEHP